MTLLRSSEGTRRFQNYEILLTFYSTREKVLSDYFWIKNLGQKPLRESIKVTLHKLH